MTDSKNTNTPIAAFVRNWCDLIPLADCKQRVETVYNAWRAWCKEQGLQTGTLTQFTELRNNYCEQIGYIGLMTEGLALKDEVMDKLTRSV